MHRMVRLYRHCRRLGLGCIAAARYCWGHRKH